MAVKNEVVMMVLHCCYRFIQFLLELLYVRLGLPKVSLYDSLSRFITGRCLEESNSNRFV